MMELKDGTRVLVGVTESLIFLHLELKDGTRVLE